MALRPFENKIIYAFVYGSIARRKERATSDVDLMAIGTVGLSALAPTLAKVEKRLGREVNVTDYSENEFRKKVVEGDHFLTTVLKGSVQFVKGEKRDLDAVVGKKEVQRHKTSKNELDKLRAVIRRDLADASLGGRQQTDVSRPPTMQHFKRKNGHCVRQLSRRRGWTPQDFFRRG